MKAKKQGYGLETQTFRGASGRQYMVFKARNGGFHVFAEVEAKNAASDCGAKSGHTRERWKSLWRSNEAPVLS
jgi:hypothetical protein